MRPTARISDRAWCNSNSCRFYCRYTYPVPNSDKDSLDLVYIISVFQEIPDKTRTLKEVNRVLRLGEILTIAEFLIDPDYPFRVTTVKQGKTGDSNWTAWKETSLITPPGLSNRYS